MDILWIIDKRAGILLSVENPTNSDKAVEDLALEGFDVIITIADYNLSISWKVGSKVTLRHYQCALDNFPEPNNWELQHLNEFLLYEIHHDRRIVLWCEDLQTCKSVKASIDKFFRFENIGLSEFIKSKLVLQPERARNIPHELTHCKACKEKRCVTDLVCHVTSVTDAEMILNSGVILSACKARNKSGQDLALEKRNAAGDPPDYFEYIMFTFGNCTAGDRLVMERALRTPPTYEELIEEFNPGVRFYFRYIDLVSHPRFCSDGYHYCKIKDLLELGPYFIAVIAPEDDRTKLLAMDSSILKERIAFVDSSSYGDLWSWSQKTYEVAREYSEYQ